MFVDRARIIIKSGDGGDGKVSFRREKYIPNGGPDGGDGGKGGDIIFIVDSNMRTLMDFRYKRKHVAENGEIGGANNCFGKSGKSLYIKVPPGTVIKDADADMVIGDLKKDKQELIAANGGKGGKGNAQFATPTRQTPRFAIPGEKGVERNLILELKLIADVGLVGFPNVGKSTLLSIATAAKPKIADYHFTTLSPNLGVVALDRNRTFVIADIPGLIEGAHEGAGLGLDFLRHVERTKIIIHVIDASGVEGRDPLDDFRKVNEELQHYSDKLASKVQIVACNKMDIPGADKNFERIKKVLIDEGYRVMPISGATKAGIKDLLNMTYNALMEYIDDEEEEIEYVVDVSHREKDNVKGYSINIENNIYKVTGEFVDRLLASVNIHDNESLKYFQRIIRKKGIIEELKSVGINNGDTVKMNDHEFEFFE